MRFRPRRLARPGGIRILAAVLFGCLRLLSPSVHADRATLNFNPDWRFIKSDPAGAEAVAFSDAAWEEVSTPHTYNDVDTFAHWSTPGHRGEQLQWSGRTWYRKHFTLPPESRGKKVYIEFEAVRQVAEVYCNGRQVGVAKTGFTPFGFDLTPFLKWDAPNVLAVMADNRFMKDPLDAEAGASVAGASSTSRGRSSANPNLDALSEQVNRAMPENIADLAADQIPWNNPHWHPAHGGIYRNVRMYITDPLHISLPLYSFLQTAGPYAYATQITPAAAEIGVEVPLENHRALRAEAELTVEVTDAAGKAVLKWHRPVVIEPGASITEGFGGTLPAPRLWEPDYPYIYRVVCSLASAGEAIDTAEVPLGIRAARWDAAAGFFLNGNHVKLHGWGQKPTDEWPGLGAAQPNWLHGYTLELMQAAGGNFVRWGHAAAGPASIAAGDRLGIIALQPGVDGEHDTVGAAWKLRAAAFRDTVIYFRNNPSILVWEGGNQKVSREHARELRGYMDLYDPHGGRAYAHRRADAITAEFMDVQVGTEGGREISSLPVVEGEYDREESPRRVWDKASPPNYGYPEAKGMTYDLTSEEFAVNQANQYITKLGPSWHSGGANWIFSDSTSGGRVPAEVARAGGEVDGMRLPKEAYAVMMTMFRPDPQVHLLGHWTYPAGTVKTVYVAANTAEVELYINNESRGLGRRLNAYIFEFPQVVWVPGKIEARGRTSGKVLQKDILETAGAPVALRLTAHLGPRGFEADGADVALVDVEAVDSQGRRCPTFQSRVDFAIVGPGVWRGGYNSGRIDSVNNLFLELECGVNRVSVRSTRVAGAITVTAQGDGLAAGSVVLRSQPVVVNYGGNALPPAEAAWDLPGNIPVHSDFTGRNAPAVRTKAAGDAAARPGMRGKYISSFNYTGPAGGAVQVRSNLAVGEKVYSDQSLTFADLPDRLRGADWIQAANADANYSAVDLMELAVGLNAMVEIAHDERAATPAWLAHDFQPTGTTVTIGGVRMALFRRPVKAGESVTLGSNSDDPRPGPARQYLVFVTAAAPARAP